MIRFLFYILIGMGIAYTARSLYGELPWIPNAGHEFAYINPYNNNKPSPTVRAKWVSEYNFHLENGKRTFKDAQDRCAYLPNTDDRTKAKYCFTSAISLVGSSTPGTKLVAAVTTFLVQYGIDCMDEWHYINNKLNWSKYHFEMCDFYRDLLDKA